MLYTSPPLDFVPNNKSVGCFVTTTCGRMLCIRRAPYAKFFPEHWGLPAGKIHVPETRYEAMVRELYEETGMNGDTKLQELGTVYVRLSTISFVFTLFVCILPQPCAITLNTKEHSAHQWSLPDTLPTPLFPQTLECLHLFRSAIPSKVFR